MELDNAPSRQVCAYRKPAWTIEGLQQHVGLVHRQTGRLGLERIKDVGPRQATGIDHRIQERANLSV